MKKQLCVYGALIVLFLVTGPAGAGEVRLSAESAHESGVGVEFSIDGKNDRSFIENHHPEAETTYRAGFWINPSGLIMANKSAHNIFEALGPDPGGNGNTMVFDVVLVKNKKGVLKIKGFAYHEPGLNLKKTKTKTIIVPDDGWSHLVIEWRASSDNQSPDGLARLSLDDGAGTPAIVEINGRVQNQGLVIEKARIGAVRGVDAGTGGVFSIDTFESFRDLTGE